MKTRQTKGHATDPTTTSYTILKNESQLISTTDIESHNNEHNHTALQGNIDLHFSTQAQLQTLVPKYATKVARKQ